MAVEQHEHGDAPRRGDEGRFGDRGVGHEAARASRAEARLHRAAVVGARPRPCPPPARSTARGHARPLARGGEEAGDHRVHRGPSGLDDRRRRGAGSSRARGGRGSADHCSSSSAMSVGSEGAPRAARGARALLHQRRGQRRLHAVRFAAGAVDHHEGLAPLAQPIGHLVERGRSERSRAAERAEARVRNRARRERVARGVEHRRAPAARAVSSTSSRSHMPCASQQRTIPSGAMRANSAAMRFRLAAVGRTVAGVCRTTQRASIAAAVSSDSASAASSAAPGASSPTTRGSTTLKTKPGPTSLRHFQKRPRARHGGVHRPELEQVEASFVFFEIALEGGSPTRRRAIAGLFTRSGTTAWGCCARRFPSRSSPSGRPHRDRPPPGGGEADRLANFHLVLHVAEAARENRDDQGTAHRGEPERPLRDFRQGIRRLDLAAAHSPWEADPSAPRRRRPCAGARAAAARRAGRRRCG